MTFDISNGLSYLDERFTTSPGRIVRFSKFFNASNKIYTLSTGNFTAQILVVARGRKSKGTSQAATACPFPTNRPDLLEKTMRNHLISSTLHACAKSLGAAPALTANKIFEAHESHAFMPKPVIHHESHMDGRREQVSMLFREILEGFTPVKLPPSFQPYRAERKK